MIDLGALSADAAGQLDVLGHDGDALGVDGAQVGVLKQADQVGLRSLLKSSNGRRLETQIGLEVLRDLTNLKIYETEKGTWKVLTKGLQPHIIKR